MARDSYNPWLQEISDGRNDQVFRLRLSWLYTLSPIKASVERKARMFSSISIKNEKRQADERAEFQRQMKSGNMEDPMARTRRQFGDLAVTWRIWIRGPRATKYFWADAKGNLSDHQ